jgi:hypothetical protein
MTTQWRQLPRGRWSVFAAEENVLVSGRLLKIRVPDACEPQRVSQEPSALIVVTRHNVENSRNTHAQDPLR